jgi:hypothetical protein
MSTDPLQKTASAPPVEAGESFDRHDWGGCGCALDSEHNVKAEPPEERR